MGASSGPDVFFSYPIIDAPALMGFLDLTTYGASSLSDEEEFDNTVLAMSRESLGTAD
jgi:hypothetical protein